MGATINATRFAITGFGMKKFSIYDREAPPADKASLVDRQSETNFIVLRYADILLMYAEAQNEYAGPDATVYDALDTIRGRVAMPKIARNLSKDDLRKVMPISAKHDLPLFVHCELETSEKEKVKSEKKSYQQ